MRLGRAGRGGGWDKGRGRPWLLDFCGGSERKARGCMRDGFPRPHRPGARLSPVMLRKKPKMALSHSSERYNTPAEERVAPAAQHAIHARSCTHGTRSRLQGTRRRPRCPPLSQHPHSTRALSPRLDRPSPAPPPALQIPPTATQGRELPLNQVGAPAARRSRSYQKSHQQRPPRPPAALARTQIVVEEHGRRPRHAPPPLSRLAAAPAIHVAAAPTTDVAVAAAARPAMSRSSRSCCAARSRWRASLRCSPGASRRVIHAGCAATCLVVNGYW